MSDLRQLLVELRHHESEYASLVHGPLCGRAADEIDSLRAQLASARKALLEIEQFDRMWTSMPYENEVLERATSGNVLVRGSCGQRAYKALTALTDENGKPSVGAQVEGVASRRGPDAREPASTISSAKGNSDEG